MNIRDFSNGFEKPVATKKILRDNASTTLVEIGQDAILKDHQSMTEALLILISGSVTYEEEARQVQLDSAMDFVQIPAHKTHRVKGVQDSMLLLIQ